MRDTQVEMEEESVVRTSLKKQVEEFLNEDSNSSPCPDKKKVGVRYRLAFLGTLHEKFLSEYPNTECSYSQFTRLVPPHIKKPKPTDWGTCLCMTCLNPQLMLEGLKRSVKKEFNGISIEEDLLRYSEKELEEFKKKIVTSCKKVSYLHWEKVKTVREKKKEEKEEEKKDGEKEGEKKKKKKTVAYAYVSEKQNLVDCGKVFAAKFMASLRELKEHTDRMVSQYRRIKEVKLSVDNVKNDSAAVRIDWSENATLMQTRQEKGDYYKDIQISVNTIVIYQPDGAVTSHASISDYTCHRAPATWASLKEILAPLQSFSKLFIISDSPSSQYRNHFNVFLTKKWAEEHNIEITWVFTEVGHGKGPMDGVGGAMKRTIDDVLAFNPNEVIRCTDQLLKFLPESEIRITTYTREDVDVVEKSMPKKIKVKSQKGVGVTAVHEIKFPVAGDDIFWKPLSSDKAFITGTISVKRRVVTSKSKDVASTSKDVDFQGPFQTSDDDNSSSSDEEIEELVVEPTGLYINMPVVIEYERELFPGKITKILSELYVQVNCLVKSSRFGSVWKWPPVKDENSYPICDIKMKDITMELMPGTQRNVEFHVPELDYIWGEIKK